MTKKVIKGINDLLSKHPEIEKTWDYSKNSVLPSEVYCGSPKRVFLLCEKGHSVSRPAYKAHSFRCEECERLKRCIANKPYIMKFLIPEENPHIDIYNTYSYQDCLVNWHCKVCGYQWTSQLRSRTTDKCPCHDLGTAIQPGYNDVFSKVPVLKLDFNQEDNPEIDMEHIGVGDKKHTINWTCHNCGYKWPSTVFSRTRYHNGKNKINKCPVEGKNKRIIGFDKQFPFLIPIYSKLNKIPLSEVTGMDYHTVFIWECERHGRYEAKLSVVLRSYKENGGFACKICSGRNGEIFGYKHPDLLEEWVYELNSLYINPFEITENSTEKAWFKCKKCQKIYPMIVNERVIYKKRNRVSCPFEKGKNINRISLL